MNKVTSYLKNVGKSVAYATMDFAEKKWVPEVTEFKETNKELFKAVYATVSHSKQSIAYGKKLAKESQIYKDINAGIDNVKEDIKTGKFYNKERADAGIEAAGEYLAGGGFDDFGDDFSFDDWDDDGSLDDFGDDDEPSSVTKGDLVIADSVAKSGNLSAQLISKTVANTSSNIIKTTMATTNMTMAQNVELVAGIRTSIAGVHESINSLVKFATEAIPMQTNIQSQFFTDSMAVMKESNAILKEMLEMQRNVYQQQQQEFKSKDQFGSVFAGGTLDLTEYAKAIWKNTKSLDKTGSLDMIFSDMGGSTMLGQMLTNPLGGLVTSIITSFMPGNFVKQVASFSKTLGSIFPVMISKLNKWKKDDRGGIYTILGTMFGLETDNKKSIDTSKYNKGAVAFDGITRKAIVDVIPEHLAKIESLLSGTSQRTYDYETGKWINYKDIKKKKQQDYDNIVKNSFYELNDDIKEYIRNVEKAKGLTADSKRQLESDILDMMRDVFEGDENFSPEQIKYKYENNDLMRGLGEYLSTNVPLSKLMSVSANVAEGKNRQARNMADAETKGYDILRKIFDNSNNDDHLKYDKEFPDYVAGNKAGTNLLNIKDSSGYNVLNYLKEILVNVSYIRQFGGSGGGGRKRGKTKPPGFDSYSKTFDKTYVQEDLEKERKKKQDSDDYYNKQYRDYDVYEEEAINLAIYEGKRKSAKNPFTDLDEDDFANVGKRYKEETEWMKKMEKIKGNTFSEKWKNAYTAEDKRILIKGTMDTAVRKPVSALSSLIDKANRSIYNFLFKAETDEEDIDGEKIKGFFNAMLAKMRSKWDELTTTLDEKVITPLVKKFGLDEKWENLKNKFKGSKPAEIFRNAKDKVGSALFKDFSGIYNYTKNSVSDTLGPVLYDKNFARAQVDRIKARYVKSNSKDIESLKKDLSGLSKDDLDYIKKNAPPEFLKMIEDAGFNEGGTGIVEEPGSIQVSEGEIVHIENPDKSNSKENREKELDNALKEWVDTYVNKRSKRTRSSFAKVRRINENARKYNSTVVSDTLSKGVNELKNEVAVPLYNNIASYIGIKGDTEKEQKASIEKEKKSLLRKVGSIIGEMEGEGASTASKAIIGGGVGLLSGIVGGPLIGASLGAATSLIKNSKTINEAVFGKNRKYDENGMLESKEGGLISKDIQNAFKKYIPDMGKYGATGAIASFLLPFGPLAGAVIGAGVGLAKNSQTMNEMIFGKEMTDEEGNKSRKGGLLSEDRMKTIKKYLPKAAVGAAAGMFLGPFGILGNAAIGAGAGMLTGTEEFKELIFGEDDGHGNRLGGLKGALQEHFIDPLKNFATNFKDDFFGFIKESMIDPLNDAITPITHEVAFWAKKIGIGIPKWLLSLGRDYIAQPLLDKLSDYIGRPIAKGIKSLFGGLFSKAKGLISLPFRMVGGLGNITRKHQIKRGTDVVGTAKDRLKFAKDKGMNDYDYQSFDERLSEKSEDTEYLEELTARTGMLAHGSEYFNKEVKKARTELSRVLNDYYKLGWFAKDKKSYNRIRQYIHNNDVEAAIEELTNIKESRSTGGPLDKESSDVIARFNKANKKYQVARYNRDKFGNINETQNAEWMEKQFGPNWRKMKADRLFDYSRRELSKAGGKNIGKSDLFSDPRNIVTKGESEINSTLQDIFRLLKDKNKFADREVEKDYNTKADSAIANAAKKLNKNKLRFKKKFAKFGLSDETLDALYQKSGIQNLVLAASSKGIIYDNATVKKLCDMNLSSGEINLLRKYPAVATLDEKDIRKNLDYTRNNHGTVTNNRFFGAKYFRNKNLQQMSLMALEDKANNDLRSGNISAMSADEVSELGKDPSDKYTYVKTDYGLRRYYKDKNGEMALDMSDSETKESLEREQEATNTRKTFMSSITNMKDSLLGFFDRSRKKDEEEEKEPWYKKLFNFDLGTGISTGGAILGLLTGVGAIKGLWDNSKENNGVVYRIGSAVGEAVGPYVTKLKDWFTNEGEYADTQNTGFQGFLNTHVFPNMFKGINVIFSKIVPAVITSFIKNIPTLIKSALTGVGSLFGWIKNDDHKNDVSFHIGDITFGVQSIGSSINTGSSTWVNDAASDASQVADSINSIDITQSNSITSPNVSDGTTANATNSAVDRSARGGSTDNSTANNLLLNSNIDPNAYADEIAGIGKIYTKDANGNLVQATYKSLAESGEFWNEAGTGHWVIDEATGNITAAEDSKTSTDSNVYGQLAKRLGYSTFRSAVTKTKAGIFSNTGKKVLGGINTGLSKTIGKLPGIGGIYKTGSTAIGAVGNLFEKASIGTAKEGAKAATKAAAKNVEQNKGLLTRVLSFIETKLESLFKISTIKEKLKESLKAAGKDFSDKAIEKTNKSIVGKIKNAITKKLESSPAIVSKIAKNISKNIAAVAFLVWDFLSGIDRAESILKIKDPSIFQTLIAGLANVITNRLLFGIIDTSTIVDLLIDTVLPIFNIDTSEIQKLREETSKEVEEYNKANADNLSEEEYLENNESLIGKFKSLFKKNKNSTTTSTTRVSSTYDTSGNTYAANYGGKGGNFRGGGAGRKSKYELSKYSDMIASSSTQSYPFNYYNRGISKGLGGNSRGGGAGRKYSGFGTFVSQLDPKYKNKKFNISGDTEYQTLGDSGCAPATAANVLNFYTGQGSVMDNASSAALRYKDKNGGVTPDYFDNYLGKNGIGTYSTTNKQELLSGISSGQPTILLGTDPTNKSNTPYGASSSHYVLATGLDGKGNVIIQDPESRKPNALYPVEDVIRQSQMGMITAAGKGTKSRTKSITTKLRSKFKKIGFGKGTSEEIEKKVWSSLRGAGLTEEQVAGAMGNIKHESGFNPSIVERGTGVGFGLCQWSYDRRKQLEKYAKSVGRNASDVEVQIAFLIAEMTPGGGANGYAKYQFMQSSSSYDGKSYPADAFRTATDVETATRAFCFCFERPNANYSHIDRRITSAKEYYKKYTGTEATSIGNSSSSSASSNNAMNSLFDAFKADILGHYDSSLINLFWGDTTTDTDTSTTSMPSSIDATGSALAVIQTAENEIGTKADSGKNQKYGEEYGYNGVDWCVIFAWWVFKHAGCPELFYGGEKTAAVSQLMNHYRNNNRMVSINSGEPGDIIFFNWNGGTSGDHVGIIESRDSDGYTTIEGNTGGGTGQVMRKKRSVSLVCAIARPNYATSGMGSSLVRKSNEYYNSKNIRHAKSGNIAAAMVNKLSGKGTMKTNKYANYIQDGKTSKLNGNSILTKSKRANMKTNTISSLYNTNGKMSLAAANGYSISGKGTGFSLPSLKSTYTTTSGSTNYAGNTSSSARSSNTTENLLSVIIEILQIIANNSEKLSEIVTLLSKALNLELTNDDISGLSSNNAKIKNKIANALKSQGSVNGLGNSSMSASTESLAAAMYSIARA